MKGISIKEGSASLVPRPSFGICAFCHAIDVEPVKAEGKGQSKKH
jgi:hypothetical protein